ncbi:MAG: ParB/RepB/Spo0J family partition protein [Clostridia bacterium]|nr:ParB/RepB/Spo0J family partition protein [Clostridia bacterium]
MGTSKGLGRGLNALFDDIEEVKSVTTKEKKKVLDSVVELNVTDVEPMPNQPRKVFDEKKLEELADSVREHGVIQPIIVEKADEGYHIVAGERRWRAAKIVGLKTIPAIVKDYTESKRKQVALIENIQREDLNVMEVARALKELMEIDEYTVTEVAKVTGKSQSAVSNIVRLLKLTPEVQEYVLDGKLVEGQARALLTIEDAEEQVRVAKKVIEKKLTVREVEKLIYEDANKYNVKKKKVAKKSSLYKAVEDKLSEYFGMKVKVDASKQNQRLIIEYYNNEGLESILEKLEIEL